MAFIKRYNILTKKQKELGKYVEKFISLNGYRPTLKQIGKHLGLRAKSSVWNRYRGYMKNMKNCPFCGHKLKVKKQISNKK